MLTGKVVLNVLFLWVLVVAVGFSLELSLSWFPRRVLPNNGGFYKVNEIPKSLLEQLTLSQKKIYESAGVVGKYVIEVPLSVNSTQVQLYRNHCRDTSIRKWNWDFCEDIASSECDNGCRVLRPGGCGGIFIDRFYITSRHCVKNKGNGLPPRVRFIDSDNAIREVSLTATNLTDHAYPYDLSIYRIPNNLKSFPSIRLRVDDPRDDEPVFALGFPRLESPRGRGDWHGSAYGDQRVTLGHVTNANALHHSFCTFTNHNDFPKGLEPESWELEQDCSNANSTVPSYEKYGMREEHDPFLTDTDMTFGMSGSALFDREGHLLGIGSNVLSNNPIEYNLKHAVYIKSNHIADLLRIVE